MKPKGLSVARMIVSWTMHCAGCALFILVGAVVSNAFRGGLSLSVQLWTLAAAVVLSGFVAYRGRAQLDQIGKWLFLVPAVVPLVCFGVFLMGSIEHGFESRGNFATMGVLIAIGLTPAAWWAVLRDKAAVPATEPGTNATGATESPWG